MNKLYSLLIGFGICFLQITASQPSRLKEPASNVLSQCFKIPGAPSCLFGCAACTSAYSLSATTDLCFPIGVGACLLGACLLGPPRQQIHSSQRQVPK